MDKLPTIEEGRCTGHYCRIFLLPYAPDDLTRRSYELQDGVQIAEMVRYEGEGEAPNGAHGHLYSCRNLLESGDCAVYFNRPHMCSAYPYGHECTYPGCTYVPDDETGEAEG